MCCSEQVDDAQMIGALRQKRRELLERPWSLATGLACSWDQCGASWTERERLRCVGPEGGLSIGTGGCRGSSGCSRALEGLGRLRFARGDSQETLGALRIGCDGLQRWEFFWFLFGCFWVKSGCQEAQGSHGQLGVIGREKGSGSRSGEVAEA